MKPVKFNPEEKVIQQGDPGDRFYVLTKGHCVVIKNQRQVNECKPGDGFGDLALLFNQPRAATVKATIETECYFLTSEHFKSFMMQARQAQIKKYEQLLKEVKILNKLKEQEIYMIAQAMRPFQASAGTDIIVQGEDGDVFFFIEQGEVQVIYNGNQVAILKTGSYFGEAALLHNCKRNATVRSIGIVNCATLDRDTFVNLIGKLEGLEDGRKNE
uniref:cAMP-dependent protein kinase regulatory chain n=1 Tax=Trepomonas sp. PC1 TaxID=1076344 RepID=A0A146KBH3_9EUKA|eukprot:JAP92866.1 cAMP-dependent protein kinase regulatory chain [Trepomonas sp. PC1]